jgi:hypothetical protein
LQNFNLTYNGNQTGTAEYDFTYKYTPTGTINVYNSDLTFTNVYGHDESTPPNNYTASPFDVRTGSVDID